MKIIDAIKNKIIAGLVSNYGPAISTSISTAVGGAVGGLVAFVHDKLPPAAWEWAVIAFKALPDDVEAKLTPASIGALAGIAFYGCLQEWLNRRQAKGVKEIQKAANSVAGVGEKIAEDGVVRHDGETANAVKTVAKRSLGSDLRSRRG